MNFYLLDATAVIVALVCLRSWIVWRSRRAVSFPLPPGPKGLPIFGNVLDIAGETEWEAARRWGEKYGDLVYIKIFGTRYLYLNSYEAAIELFERRGSIYSGRHHTTMLVLEGWSDWFTSVLPYGDELRKSRQYVNKFFQRKVTKEYYEVQTQSAHRLLLRLLQDPVGYRQHIRQSAAESIIKITYGFEIVQNDPNVELIDKGIRAISDSLVFNALNALPALRYLPTWFPGAHFHEILQEGCNLSAAMQNGPFNEARGKMVDGNASPSILSKLLESSLDGEKSSTDESRIAKTAAVVYGAGGDTSVASLLTFILAMVLHPEVMRKGREELDRVIGRDNLPVFQDRPKLSYVEAICTECLRWQTVTGMGVPHVVEQDDVYDGYFIPAGTVVVGNAWAMLRDPKRYPEPDKFIPERWLPGNGKERPLDANKIAFGFGRRICPGRFFAENSLFIGAASILAVFDIEKAVDEQGDSIIPKEDFVPSIVRHPMPFKCKITPRSEEAAALVRQAAALASA